jgi:hypothetical protein
MRQDILKIATKEFQKLFRNYDKFINVIIDDWRGFRFVFDTADVRNCRNDCLNCDLYKMLKDEKSGFFSAGLYSASEEDRKIFGPQNFLNCKTLKQYQNCYINFIQKKVRTKKELVNELKLLERMSVVYAGNKDKAKIEKRFKTAILRKIRNKV